VKPEYFQTIFPEPEEMNVAMACRVRNAAFQPYRLLMAQSRRFATSNATPSMCDELLIDTTLVPGVALVTFNRPARLNALSLDMGEAVMQLHKALPSTTRAVVFTGVYVINSSLLLNTR
jgi:hypothetical protein